MHQSVLVRTNGVVIASYKRSPLPAIPPTKEDTDTNSSRLYTSPLSEWQERSPKGEPGLLPFWMPKPREGQALLMIGPRGDEDMARLTGDDVERTTNWFVRALATYLDEHT